MLQKWRYSAAEKAAQLWEYSIYQSFAVTLVFGFSGHGVLAFFDNFSGLFANRFADFVSKTVYQQAKFTNSGYLLKNAGLVENLAGVKKVSMASLSAQVIMEQSRFLPFPLMVTSACLLASRLIE